LTRQRAADGYAQARSFLSAEIQVNARPDGKEHATGDEEVLRAVVSEISVRPALDEVLPRFSPETEALIDELLPSWRSSAA
jgi:hypothetical protein